MPKYEYIDVMISLGDGPANKISKMGAEGWKVVSFHQRFPVDGYWIALMEREVQPPYSVEADMLQAGYVNVDGNWIKVTSD